MNFWWMREHALLPGWPAAAPSRQRLPAPPARPSIVFEGSRHPSPQPASSLDRHRGNYLLLRVIPWSSKNARTVPPAAPDGWRTPWWERPGAAKIITGCQSEGAVWTSQASTPGDCSTRTTCTFTEEWTGWAPTGYSAKHGQVVLGQSFGGGVVGTWSFLG